MQRFMRRIAGDRAGATAIEYALIAALVVVVIVTAVTALGAQLVALFNNVVAQFP